MSAKKRQHKNRVNFFHVSPFYASEYDAITC